MRRHLPAAALLLVLRGLLFAQSDNSRLISFDFVDQQIREILYAFSSYSRISIIGDDTVTGTASFYFLTYLSLIIC